MSRVILYSVLLIGGLIFSNLFSLEAYSEILTLLTMTCLGYIMIEVGMEFVIDKDNLSSYVKDYLVAMLAAGLPWIFCAIYFLYYFDLDTRESLLVSRFAAPTSAGILFAMLAAVGLGSTWLFRKARILAIFDDLDTILFMIPLQMMFVGSSSALIYQVLIILLLFVFGFIYLHKLRIPTGWGWRFIYSAILVGVCYWLEHRAHIELEILIPSFIFGCLLYNPHEESHTEEAAEIRDFYEPIEESFFTADLVIKAVFMFLVGASLPKASFTAGGLQIVAWHVLAITVLSNIGKMAPAFFYKKEASFRERIAVSIAMFPRGEVGAGVLLLSMDYGISEEAVSIAAFSLALNLLLTGVFIFYVIWLIKPKAILK